MPGEPHLLHTATVVAAGAAAAAAVAVLLQGWLEGGWRRRGLVTLAAVAVCLCLLTWGRRHLQQLVEIFWGLPIYLKWWAVFVTSGFYGAALTLGARGKRGLPQLVAWSPVLAGIVLLLGHSQLLREAGGTLWLCWLANAVGFRLLGKRQKRLLFPLPFALGLALFTAAAWLAGTCKLLVPPLLQASALGLTALLWRQLLDTARGLWRWCVRPLPRRLVVAAYQGLAWAVILIACLAAVAPEVGSDAVGARVALTARFLGQGSLAPFPDILWSYGVMGGEALQTWFFPFAGSRVSRFLAMAVVASLAFSRLYRSTPAGSVCAPLLISSLVLVHFAMGGVDLVQTLFWVSAGWAVLEARKRPNFALIAGFLAGSATAVKLNGVGALAGGGLALLLAVRPWRGFLQRGALFALAALGALGPWLWRSYALTGNPLFPFVQNLFPGSLQSPPPLHRFGLGLAWPAVLTVPYLIWQKPEKFVEVGAYNPALVAAFAVALVGLGLRLPRALAFLALFTWLFWLVTEQNLRYSLPAAHLSVAAAALLFLPRRGPLRKNWLPEGLLLAALSAVAHDFTRPTGWLFRAPSGVPTARELLTGEQTAAQYLDAMLPSSALGAAVRASQQPWPQVCQSGLRDHLYVPGTQPTDWHSLQPLSTWIAQLRFAPSVDKATQAVRRLHCDFLMLNLGNDARLPADRRPAAFSETFWERYGSVVAAARQTVLLRRYGTGEPGPATATLHTFAVPWAGGELQPEAAGEERPSLRGGRAWSEAIALPAGGLLRCSWRAQRPSQGYLDLVARNQAGGLVLFHRQDFQLQASEVFTFYQTLPTDTFTVNFHLTGSFSLPDITCTLQ